ncbi:MAG: ATP-binding cassette domain-containing protein [Aestuariivirga sp.]|uniref:ATP-binding cassette domain-containing protein n=1 Tax=Aestuariivirga sp. TaxID=2650926 RepID=UPI0038D04C55
MLVEARNISLDVPDMNHRAVFGARRRLRILRNVSLSIAKGETVGIAGESGSGKTSLGRTLLRLHEPGEGRLLFDGADITHEDPARLKPLRRRMQMIFQDPQSSLNPRQTVGRILSTALRLHGLPADSRTLSAILDRVGLPASALTRYPHQLSGGQRQRVGIARAISLKPDFVVADEIVSGLDVSTQAQVLDLLRSLRADMGMALAFISHDLSVVRHLCARVVIMREGGIIETGDTARVFAAPQTAFTRTLIDSIPLPEIRPGWLDQPASR